MSNLVLPFGFDRGDGVTILPPSVDGSTLVSGTFGTPTPPSVLLIQSANGSDVMSLEEDPESPTIERAEQATSLHSFTMSYQAALMYIGVISRGLLAQDSGGNLWRVLSASIQAQRGGKATLKVACESVSFDTPPDDFQVNTVDMGIDILKHPRYFPNIFPTVAELGTEVGAIKETLIRAVQAYRDSPFFPTTASLAGLFNGMVQENVVGLAKAGQFAYLVPNPLYDSSKPTAADLDSNGNPQAGAGTPGGPNTVHLVHFYPSTIGQTGSVDLAIAAVMEMITKLWRMEDSPYMPAVEVKWTQYSFLPPDTVLGSYLEDPTFIIPDYFLKPDRFLTELPPRNGIGYPTAGADNIFALNASLNPQDYSSDGQGGPIAISWLRKADEVVYQRTWFEITRTWVGSAIGMFDQQLYGAYKRPQGPTQDGGKDGGYIVFS